MCPKKILFTLTVLLVVFSFNLSYSQEVDVYAALNHLQSKADILNKETSIILDDLRAVSQSFSDSDLDRDCTRIIVSIREGSDLVTTTKLILASKEFVDKNKMKGYFQYIDTNLRLFHHLIAVTVGGLETEIEMVEHPKAVTHFTKKAVKIFDEYLGDMESTIKALDNAIKSMP